MTEQELREKIAKIIYHIGCTGACCECNYSKVSESDTYCKALLKADALIVAGVGDVSEWKHRAESYKKALKGLARQYVLLRGYKTKQVNFDVDGETIQIFLNEEDEKAQEDKK